MDSKKISADGSGVSDCKGSAVKKLLTRPRAWLFKVEPNHHSYSDLERDGSTLWDGVTNNLARLNLRKVRRGWRLVTVRTGKFKP